MTIPEEDDRKDRCGLPLSPLSRQPSHQAPSEWVRGGSNKENEGVTCSTKKKSSMTGEEDEEEERGGGVVSPGKQTDWASIFTIIDVDRDGKVRG